MKKNTNILVVDDTVEICKNFQVILQPENKDTEELAAMEAELFGAETSVKKRFQVQAVHNGKHGVNAVQISHAKDSPYALAFVDMKMPGMDGLETIEKIFALDSEIQVVLCTAYSDRSWEEITKRLGDTDRFLILKKPFDKSEVLQLAHTLTTKWELARQMQESLIEAQKARKLAEEAVRIQKSFLANMGHELRTPLHAIKYFTETSLEKIQNQEYVSVEGNLSEVCKATERLLKLLNNLLDLSKLEADEVIYDIEQYSLSDVMTEVISSLSSINEVKGVRLNVKSIQNTKGSFDRDRMIQVGINIIGNAIKFSPNDGNILVQLFQNKDQIGFSVSDEGPGIPEDEINLVFDKFFQTRKTRTGAGGTGLGLAICKEVVEAHKGKIWAENNEGKGSMFSVTIPRTQ